MPTTPRIDSDEIKSRINLIQFFERELGEPEEEKYEYSVWSCPFHSETTGSFTVWEDHYYCFACFEYGDIYTYLQKTRSMTFYEALKMLSENVMLEPIAVNQRRKPKEKKPRPILSLADIHPYETQIHRVEPYLSSRMIEGGVIGRNHIGGDKYHRTYVTLSGKRFEFECNRVALPAMFSNQALSLNFRRDELSAKQNLARLPYGTFDIIREDIARRKERDPHDVSIEKVFDEMFGLRYYKPKRFQDAMYGTDQIIRRTDGKLVYPRMPYVLITEGELNAVVAQRYGFVCLAGKANKSFDLKRTFQNIGVIYIVQDNDRDRERKDGTITNAGEKHALAMLAALGRQDNIRIIRMPDGKYNDLNDLAKAGLLEEFLTRRPYHLEPKL